MRKSLWLTLAFTTCVVFLNGADANSRLFEQLKSNDISGISEAINAGADPNALDDRGRSALWIARWNHSLECFNHLLQFGADPNAPAIKSGNTILAELTGDDALPFLTAFLNFGGDINTPIKSASGEMETYAFRIVRLNQVALTYFAVAHGLKTSSTDARGRTLLKAAVDARRYQVACALVDLGIVTPAIDLAPTAFEGLYDNSTGDLEPRFEYWRKKLSQKIAEAKANTR